MAYLEQNGEVTITFEALSDNGEGLEVEDTYAVTLEYVAGPPEPITLPNDLGDFTIQENQTGTIAQLAALPLGWAYELISGPTGVTLSANGTLATSVPFDYEAATQHPIVINAVYTGEGIESENDVNEVIDVTNEVEITQQTTGYYNNTENPSSPFPMPENFARIEETLTDGIPTDLDTITELGDDPLSAIRAEGAALLALPSFGGWENNSDGLAQAMSGSIITTGLNYVLETQEPLYTYMFSNATGQLIEADRFATAMTLMRERIQANGIPFTSWGGANPYQTAMMQFALLIQDDDQDPNAKIYDLAAQAADYAVQW